MEAATTTRQSDPGGRPPTRLRWLRWTMAVTGAALAIAAVVSWMTIRGITSTPSANATASSPGTTDCGPSDMLNGEVSPAPAHSAAKISAARAATEAGKEFAKLRPASRDLVMQTQGPPTPRLEWRLIYHNVPTPFDDVAEGKPQTVFVLVPADGSGSLPVEVQYGC